MHVYRIAKKSYINDLSGTGARLYGGRWNHVGTSLLYTSSTRALATVEFLVHVPPANLPPHLCLATINIPDTLKIETLSTSKLPPNWRQNPPVKTLADIGNAWVNSERSLALAVPSAVVLHEYNILINPNHVDIRHIKLISTEPYRLDERLMPEKNR